MAIIPTFQRQVQFTPQPITSSATTFQALSAVIGGVEQIAEKSIATQKKEALETSRFMTSTDIIKQSSKIFEDAQKQEDKQLALDQYKTSYQSYSDSLLKNIPKENKLYAERMLFSLGNQGAKKFQQQIAEQGKLAAIDEFNQTIHAFTSLASNEASSPTTNSQKNAVVHGSQVMTVVKKAVEAGIKSPEGGATILKNARKEIEDSRILAYGKVARAESESSFESFKKKILTDKSYDSIYTQDERKALVGKLNSDQALDTQRIARSQQQVTDMKNDLLTQASHTGKVNSTELSTVHEASPATFDDFNENLQLAQLNGSIVSANKYAPLGDSLNSLAEAQRPLTESELQAPGIAKKLQYRAQLATTLSNNIAAFRKDPASFTASDPEFQSEDAKLRNNTIIYSETDPRFAGQAEKYIRARDDLMLSFQSQRGLRHDELSIIDGDEAAAVATQLNNLQPSQLAPEIRKLEQRYGDNTNLAFRNLTNAGANDVNNWFRGIINNPKSVSSFSGIVQGFQLGRSKSLELLSRQGVKENDIKNAVNEAMIPYTDTIHSTNGDTLGYMLETQKSVELAAMGIMLKDHKGAQEASEEAAAAMVHNNYQYVNFTPGLLASATKAIFPSFISNKIGSGSNFRIPVDADPVSYMKAVNALYVTNTLNPPEDLVIPRYIKQQWPFLSEKEQRQIYINDNFKNANFINTNADNGVVMTDSNKVPVQTLSKGTIGMLHDDLSDPSSDVYKKIAELEKEAEQIRKEEFAKQFKETITGKTEFITQPFKALESASESAIRDLSRASFGDSESIARSDILSPTFKKLVKPRKKK